VAVTGPPGAADGRVGAAARRGRCPPPLHYIEGPTAGTARPPRRSPGSAWGPIWVARIRSGDPQRITARAWPARISTWSALLWW